MNNGKTGYLAGIIDGEGSITLINSKNPVRINPVVYITNSNMRLLQECASIIEEITGDYPSIRVTDQRGNRPVHRIQIAKRKSIQAVLKEIKPYIIAKKEQISLIDEFYSVKPLNGYWTKEQAELCEKMHCLNRGKLL